MRAAWAETLRKVAEPVLRAAGLGRLRETLPVEQRAGAGREVYAPAEALCRTLLGVAPLLMRREDALGRELGPLALAGLEHGFSDGRDRLEFGRGGQMIVEGAFLSAAFLHAPGELWEPLSAKTKERVVGELMGLRRFGVPFSNWLLFAATTEAFLDFAGVGADPMRVEYALRQHDQWYVGGGWYKDGPHFAHDYYNSFVIQPLLLMVGRQFGSHGSLGGLIGSRREEWAARAGRFARILERQIAPDGSFPVTGRSIAYRCGAFQLLALLALWEQLPEGLGPGGVRRGLTAVIGRTLGAEGTFDERGFLRIGLAGHQPSLGEGYICTGSLYLCTAAFLPLGLPATARFWTEPDALTTWERAWGGEDLGADGG